MDFKYWLILIICICCCLSSISGGSYYWFFSNTLSGTHHIVQKSDATRCFKADGSFVTLASCDATDANQQFKWDSSTSQIKIGTKCVYPTSGAIADKTLLTLTDCADDNKHWAYASNKYSWKTNSCIDVSDGKPSLLACPSSTQAWVNI